VALASFTAPAAVTQGDTATLVVTVQNVGQQDVGTPFDVTVSDATAGVILGSQMVPGLASGSSATVTFSWNTSGATLGGHALVATHGFADDNLANNQDTVVVTVLPKPTDVALTGITGPARVTQGDTAAIGVTVQNVGEAVVTATFSVLLTDGFSDTIGTQTVAGLAPGATAALTFAWNTAGAAITGHTLFARQLLPDDNPTNDTRAIGVIVEAPPAVVTDVAVTGVSAPTTASQGDVVAVGVTVGNVGTADVSAGIVVTLRDTTAGVTVGSQTVPGLAAGGSAPLQFSWNTAGTAVGGHTLVASHALVDDNAANNQASASVTVTAQQTDVALASFTAPAAVTQGDTATLVVTVLNVGQQDVGAPFTVTITDATAGLTLGSQAVPGLAAGADATLTFGWSTVGVVLGAHTLTAEHDAPDDIGTNNQRSALVRVNPRTVDLALTGITGPPSITLGDTATINVTVQNVGAQADPAGFAVALTDATAGVTVATQPVPVLALGGTTTLAYAWSTVGAALTGHTLIAQLLPGDDNPANDTRAVGVVVVSPSVHAGDLTGTAERQGNVWSATVGITVHDHQHSVLNGVTVTGGWSGPGQAVSECTSGATGVGVCEVVLSGIPSSTKQVSFVVSGMARAGYVYQLGANHDADGSSNGSTIFVKR
jgi:subtilase family serine protease